MRSPPPNAKRGNVALENKTLMNGGWSLFTFNESSFRCL